GPDGRLGRRAWRRVDLDVQRLVTLIEFEQVLGIAALVTHQRKSIIVGRLSSLLVVSDIALVDGALDVGVRLAAPPPTDVAIFRRGSPRARPRAGAGAESVSKGDVFEGLPGG